MADPAPAAPVSAEAFAGLSTLHQLTLEAGLSETRARLVFHILNRTIQLCSYDRALLWDLTGTAPRILGISGEARVDAQAPLVLESAAIVRALREPARAQEIGAPACTDGGKAFAALRARHEGLAVLWLPIRIGEDLLAGLWLERWGARGWAPAEQKILESLVLGYAVAWRAFPRRLGMRAWWSARGRAAVAIGIALLLLALAGIRLPLRVVAPCEVVPANPVAVTAPLAGVIESVCVQPGQAVDEGSLLAVYDRRVAEEECRVAAQQVEVVQSRLQRARVHALDDAGVRAELPGLAERLEEEKIRLRLAAYRVERSEIRAPCSGRIARLDPNAWRGRPVAVGERILQIVRPEESKLRIWIAEADNIRFVETRPLTVVLAADPRTALTARLAYIARQSEIGPDGIPSIQADAEWESACPELKLGLKGTAVLYGEPVCLAYWLLRRPWGALRMTLGL